MLDSFPTCWVIRIAPRHDPDAMKMIGQQANREEPEWRFVFDGGDRFSQAFPTKVCRKDRTAIIGH